jgi:lipopolysaccharide export system protein LptA
MRHRQKIVSLGIAASLLLTTFTAVWALDTDQNQVMHVLSDSATYNRDDHTITYEGKVQGSQGSAKLDGDKLVVYQMTTSQPGDNNNIEKIIVYGNPAHYSTLPNPDKARLFVEALKITYDPQKKTVLLEGHARVNQEGNIFTGPHIWYDMVNGVVHSTSTNNQERTEMIIQPQQPATKKTYDSTANPKSE